MLQINQIYNQDCLEGLKLLDDNSIDSIVCDPPYELGFMGKSWDRSGIACNVNVWLECLRILKPGGHLLAFGGTRTYHRMVCAIEDAGFEIRDQIQWLYGCLSEDTEILTEHGWELYHKGIADNPVLCYDIKTDNFIFDKPTKEYCYENAHPAYRIKSDFTDQIVSRHHRVITERNGRKVFTPAETLECEESIPFLESLRDLPESIPNLYEGTSIAKQNLLAIVWQQENIIGQERSTKKTNRKKTKENLPLVSDNFRNKRKTSEWKQKFLLQLLLSSQACISASFNQAQIRQNRNEISGDGFSRKQQSSMEGWRNVLQEAWQLYRSKICSLSNSIYFYGKERRLCYGTSYNCSQGNWETINTNRSGSSYRSRSDEQQSKQFNAIPKQQTTQAIRSTRAKVEEIEYHGKMWCVSVPTGAFVARRNGKIFITGNSGFPKSLNISKAIDKAAGAEREVIGRRTDRAATPKTDIRGGRFIGGKNSAIDCSAITSPATDAAKQWEGWGTALKPSNEPIVMARKPLSEKTIAQNVLKWGTGGINIDKCRVGNEERTYGIKGGENLNKLSRITGNDSENAKGCGAYGVGAKQITIGEKSVLGRWPANLLHDGSDEVLELFPITQGGGFPAVQNTKSWKMSSQGKALAPERKMDSGSAARFFYCAKASKSERGEGNSHPTVKPLKLMEYLVRLVTPPNGICLDPFAGSGTTLLACANQEFGFIGFELSADYCKIAEDRLAKRTETHK